MINEDPRLALRLAHVLLPTMGISRTYLLAPGHVPDGAREARSVHVPIASI